MLAFLFFPSSHPLPLLHSRRDRAALTPPSYHSARCPPARPPSPPARPEFHHPLPPCLGPHYDPTAAFAHTSLVVHTYYCNSQHCEQRRHSDDHAKHTSHHCVHKHDCVIANGELMLRSLGHRRRASSASAQVYARLCRLPRGGCRHSRNRRRRNDNYPIGVDVANGIWAASFHVLPADPLPGLAPACTTTASASAATSASATTAAAVAASRASDDLRHLRRQPRRMLYRCTNAPILSYPTTRIGGFYRGGCSSSFGLRGCV